MAAREPLPAGTRLRFADDPPGVVQTALAPLIPFGEDFWVFEVFEYEGTGPFKWRLTVAMLDGTPECIGLECKGHPDGPPITTDRLRALSLRTRVQEGLFAVAMRIVERWPDGTLVVERPYASDLEARKKAMDEFLRAFNQVKRSPERYRVSDERLREVARVYRENVALGNPSAAVARELNTSRSNARRLVSLARAGGFLGAAVSRRPGETPVDAGTGNPSPDRTDLKEEA